MIAQRWSIIAKCNKRCRKVNYLLTHIIERSGFPPVICRMLPIAGERKTCKTCFNVASSFPNQSLQNTGQICTMLLKKRTVLKNTAVLKKIARYESIPDTTVLPSKKKKNDGCNHFSQSTNR